MKRTFILLMSAVALVAILALAALAWNAQCKTVWYNNHWNACDSSPITGSVCTAYCIAVAPWWGANCGNRIVEAKRAVDHWPVAQSFCPNWDGVQTPDCCVKTTWSASAIQYLVHAEQDANRPQECGPTYGIIQSYNYTCGQPSPGGQ